MNLTFKKKEKRRKAHIVGLDSRKIIIVLKIWKVTGQDDKHTNHVTVYLIMFILFFTFSYQRDISCILLPKFRS